MKTKVDAIYKEALLLPDDSKESLAERLVGYLVTHVDPEVERAHLQVAKRRRDEIRSGKVSPIDGEGVLARARRLATK